MKGRKEKKGRGKEINEKERRGKERNHERLI